MSVDGCPVVPVDDRGDVHMLDGCGADPADPLSPQNLVDFGVCEFFDHVSPMVAGSVCAASSLLAHPFIRLSADQGLRKRDARLGAFCPPARPCLRFSSGVATPAPLWAAH